MAEPNTVGLYISRELADDAKVKAIREGVSVSAVVRVWLTQWVDGTLPTPPEAKERDRGKEETANRLAPAMA
jgi:hypothetical protein